jgi:hypothetical protein
MTSAQWIAILMSDRSPLLPDALAMHMYLRVSWLVLLLLGATCLLRRAVARFGLPASRLLRMTPVALFMLLLWVPDDLSPAYWLGLAFNMPAMLSVLLCFGLWREYTFSSQIDGAPLKGWLMAYLAGAVVLGYLLLLDTLAMLPVQLYAWGFSPAALACALLVAVIPCVALNPLQRGYQWTCLMPVALLVFVFTRLPTGNVWDVLLDPLLWVALQIYGVRKARAIAR